MYICYTLALKMYLEYFSGIKLLSITVTLMPQEKLQLCRQPQLQKVSLCL
jgi:hypothetical protein